MAFSKIQTKNNLTVQNKYAESGNAYLKATTTAHIDTSATVGEMDTIAIAISKLQKWVAGKSPSDYVAMNAKKFSFHITQ